MFKILLISLITFMIVIIAFLILMSFLDVDIITHSKSIEKFYNAQEPSFTGGAFKSLVNGSAEDYYIQFNSSGTLTIPSSITCDILMIGGGGGGGYNHGSGGGAGAYYYGTNKTLNSGTYNIFIGSGGAGGTEPTAPANGGDSYITYNGSSDLTFNSLNVRCKGGGGGGHYKTAIGVAGGCGGGADGWNNNMGANTTYSGGGTNNTGTIGTGFSGGSARQFYSSGELAGGGGGGIGGVGGNASGFEGGNGGNGLVINITGTEQVFGGGGGGGEWPAYSANPGGLGGGATLTNGTFVKVGGDAVRSEGANGGDAVVNTGSGGGGGKGGRGGNGSTGVVIIRYNISQSTIYTDYSSDSGTYLRDSNDKIIFEYISVYDSSIDVNLQSNIKLVTKDGISGIPTLNPTNYDENRYTNGIFNNKNDIGGDYLLILFKEPIILKKIIFVSKNGTERKNAPASYDIYYIENRNFHIIESDIATFENYEATTSKLNNTYIKLLENNTPHELYVFVFKSVLGGSKLDYSNIILYIGQIPQVKSSAGSSIQKNLN